jgi:hypothetical protein
MEAEAKQFLTRLAVEGGSIVSSAACSVEVSRRDGGTKT